MAGRRTPKVSVSERPKGSGRWSVRWRERGRQREERGHASEDAALDRAHTIRKELRSPLSASREDPSVANLLHEWWDDYALKTYKSGTIDLYERCVATILETGIGTEPARNITTAVVNRWSRSIDRPGTYVRNCLTVLSAAFSYAVSVGTAQQNPVRGARRPSTKRSTIIIPTMNDVVRLAIATPERDEQRWRALLLTAAFAGLRQQECFALQWRSIEWDNNRIHVVAARSATKGDGRHVSEDPKTIAGERRVPMPTFVADALRAHHATTAFPAPTDLVWGTRNRTMHTPSTFQQRIWNAWRIRAGVEVKWRHLRHFYASMVANSPEGNLLKISRWMGHAKFSFTMDTYGFLFDNEETDLMDSFEARIANA